jgi:parvulin-like peptidyl-prolyl isomerase
MTKGEFQEPSASRLGFIAPAFQQAETGDSIVALVNDVVTSSDLKGAGKNQATNNYIVAPPHFHLDRRRRLAS